MKIGDTIDTPHGAGVIVCKEEYRWFKRYGVTLHKNPFSFSPVFYFDNEIEKMICWKHNDIDLANKKILNKGEYLLASALLIKQKMTYSEAKELIKEDITAIVNRLLEIGIIKFL